MRMRGSPEDLVQIEHADQDQCPRTQELDASRQRLPIPAVSAVTTKPWPRAKYRPSGDAGADSAEAIDRSEVFKIHTVPDTKAEWQDEDGLYDIDLLCPVPLGKEPPSLWG